MATCKDCLHYEVCQYHITEETDMTVNECSHEFKDKSHYAEVKHGEWKKQSFIIFDGEVIYYNCSECNTTWNADTNYCPNCGAKMDGGNNG